MSDPEIELAAHRVFDRKAQWHREQASLQLNEKVRILLELQRLGASAPVTILNTC